MIVKFPQVDEEGREIAGAECALRFEEIIAINRLWHYNYERRDDNNRDVREIVDGCCTVSVGHNFEFHIKANYDELVERWIALSEPRYAREVVE